MWLHIKFMCIFHLLGVFFRSFGLQSPNIQCSDSSYDAPIYNGLMHNLSV